MKKFATALAVAILVSAAAGSARAEEGWSKYQAKEYGFSMLVPEGTKFVEKEYEGGWGELFAEHDGVKLYGLAKMGEQASAADIEKVGVKITGIPASKWKQVHSGKNEGGWNWWKTVEASNGHDLVVADYGTGKKGSYLIILITTEEDYAEHKADYKTWWESVTLH